MTHRIQPPTKRDERHPADRHRPRYPEDYPRRFVVVDTNPPDKKRAPGSRPWYALQWFERGHWRRLDFRGGGGGDYGRAGDRALEIANRLGYLVYRRS